jgi:hypothetical protein
MELKEVGKVSAQIFGENIRGSSRRAGEESFKMKMGFEGGNLHRNIPE